MSEQKQEPQQPQTNPPPFQISVPLEELRKRPLFLATPMYGGMASGMYTRSVMDLSALCKEQGIPLIAYFLFNESLITRARNYCVDEFLRSSATNLLFIDSDIGFNPQDVIAMLAMQSEESPYDVLTGPYPKKCISYEKIKLAVDKGFADKDPNVLANFVGDYVFNPKQGTVSINLGQPAEVSEAGTGFMMIKRSVFDKYKEAYPQFSYRPDHIRTDVFDGSREIHAYFDCAIDPESRRYLSEDYNFCYNVQKIGQKVWLCPWMKLQHVGTMVFGGSLADLAMIGAPATADAGMLKKKVA